MADIGDRAKASGNAELVKDLEGLGYIGGK